MRLTGAASGMKAVMPLKSLLCAFPSPRMEEAWKAGQVPKQTVRFDVNGGRFGAIPDLPTTCPTVSQCGEDDQWRGD